MSEEVEILGYKVFSKDLIDCEFISPNNKFVINTINAYSYVLARTDNEFKNALIKSDMLLPDGFPIVWAAAFLRKEKIVKIAGEDIFFHLLRLANRNAKRVFFLGSTYDTLQKIKTKIGVEYPSIEVDCFSPPYKTKFSDEDNKLMIDAVNRFQPDFLFVGMTAPKQEKWVEENKSYIEAQVICSIGAVFDFYAQTVKRPSKFWIKLKLEWFIRLLKEPKRLWKRYLIHSPKFMIDVFREKLSRKDK